MLAPRYLDGLSDEIAEIYSQLEADILQDMARRLARLRGVTDATEWQARMLSEAGGLKRNIARILAGYDRTIVEQVTAIFTGALETNARNDNRIFKEATGRTVSDSNAQAMLSTIQKCHSDLSRLTLTTASTTQTQFVAQANRVYMMTQSGAFDYDTAMMDAADRLADEGIRVVQYENGKPVRRSVESAVRMNILTSVNQTAANQTLNNAEELGVEMFEVSAHIGARPEHEAWQGKIFTKKQLYSVCGLGTATGLCGINCRHSFYPHIEGMEAHYGADELDEMAGEKVRFTGSDGVEHELTRYEGEQKLRGIERKIRYYKKKALVRQSAGVDDTAARRKLGEWQAVARDFVKQTGIARDYAREYVGVERNLFNQRQAQPRGTAPKEGNIYGKSADKESTVKTMNIEDIKIEKVENTINSVTRGREMTFKEADNGNVNPHFKLQSPTAENCQSCVACFKARLEGFNVKAKPYNEENEIMVTLSDHTNIAYIDKKTGTYPEYIKPGENYMPRLLAWFDKNLEEKKFYTIEFYWKGAMDGHIRLIFKENGTTIMYDPQSNEILKDKYLEEELYLIKRNSIKLINISDCDLNKTVVESVLEVRE